ncbi:potassium channel family protein [Natroniella acetigena]|uniref:potassium channel family protein n=1 Tax=Natroniella acetigena TaxID=52004 RepID=UPI00200A3700|nr:potassium channel family protein [Natroniella acetigena]MCK8826452.1 potassium channel family protein [Natroniella acetigena]
MIKLNLEILIKEDEQLKELKKVTVQTESPILHLNPDKLKEETEKKELYGIRAKINCNRAILHIKGFNCVTLTSSINNEPNLPYLKITNCNDSLQLTNLQIKRLDIENSNLRIIKSFINELNLGISNTFTSASQELKQKQLENLTTLIKHSRIKEFRIFIPQQQIEIKKSQLDRLVIEYEVNSLNEINILQNSIINRFTLSSIINQLTIDNATISHLEFRKQCQIENFKAQRYSIYNSYNCLPSTISNKSLDSWKLVMDSAKARDNSSLHALAGFEYMKAKRRKLDTFRYKIFYWLMELICGYGYKPFNTLVTGVIIWANFGLLFWFLTITTETGLSLPPIQAEGPTKSLYVLGYSLYFSAITFTTTGYGDILPLGPLAKSLASIETVLGVVLLSIFIFALTERFGSFR